MSLLRRLILGIIPGVFSLQGRPSPHNKRGQVTWQVPAGTLPGRQGSRAKIYHSNGVPITPRTICS